MGYYYSKRGIKLFDGDGEPRIGDLTHGIILSKADTIGLFRFIECPSCGNTRWVIKTAGILKCGKCAKKERDKKFNDSLWDPSKGDPKIGDITRSKTIGIKHGLYKYVKCIKCTKEYWTAKGNKKLKCMNCAKADDIDWNLKSLVNGYIYVRIKKDHPFYNTCVVKAKVFGGIHEHRLNMAIKLNRNLYSSEIVHHIDGNKLNNHPDNLELLSAKDHFPKTMQQVELYKLRESDKEKDKEIIELRKQLEMKEVL